MAEGTEDVHALPAVPDQSSAAEEAAAVADYEAMLNSLDAPEEHLGGDIVEGVILRIGERESLIDIGQKTEGVVDSAELPEGAKPGDTLEFMLTRGRHPEGFFTLSFERVNRLKFWDTLEQARAEKLLVSGRVVGQAKGGLMVDVGVRAFMPTWHSDLSPTPDLEAMIGQDIVVRVLKMNKRRGGVLVSRRVPMMEEAQARRTSLLETLEEGMEVSGTVKNLTDYGAFVDLGGIDGLLHIGDITWGRIEKPSDMLQPGDSVTARVLRLDREKGRVSLGMKQLQPDPWQSVTDRFPPESRHAGRVVSVTDYGAFVELEPGVEGLVHISEMTWSRRMRHPSRVLQPGTEIEVVVIEVKSDSRRISLGLKQLEADPWTTIEERYAVGSVVEGRVRKLTDFGAFVEIEEGIDGLVHISDFSWSKRIKHPSEIVRKGQATKAVVLSIDAQRRRLSLGIKQLTPDAWEEFFRQHHVNELVEGVVLREAQFGLFVEVAAGVEALCHNSELDPAQARPASGDKIAFRIIRMSETEKRVGLSLKSVASELDRQRIAGYQSNAADFSRAHEELRQSGDFSAGSE
jgi:small subunit ribosomal protein S1